MNGKKQFRASRLLFWAAGLTLGIPGGGFMVGMAFNGVRLEAGGSQEKLYDLCWRALWTAPVTLPLGCILLVFSYVAERRGA